MGIKTDVTLNRGDAIKVEQIETVGLPKDAVGNLKDFAVLYDRNTLRRNAIGGGARRSGG